MALPPKPKSRPVVLRTLLAGALSASALGACSDDAGNPPDATIIPPQPPPQPAPPDGMPTPDAFRPPPPQPPPQPPPPVDAMPPPPPQPPPQDAFVPIPPQPPPPPPQPPPDEPIEGSASQPGKRGR
jgi:hypothetical protein